VNHLYAAGRRLSSAALRRFLWTPPICFGSFQAANQAGMVVGRVGTTSRQAIDWQLRCDLVTLRGRIGNLVWYGERSPLHGRSFAPLRQFDCRYTLLPTLLVLGISGHFRPALVTSALEALRMATPKGRGQSPSF
jgi:hypothetical protein